MSYGEFYPTSKVELNNYISDLEIYNYYFGTFELNQWYKSPFRDEKKGSFIFSHYNNQIVWRDFGIDPRPFDSLNFISKLFNLDFHGAIKKVYDELHKYNLVKQQIPHLKIPNKRTILPTLKYSTLKAKEKEYWYNGKVTDKEIDIYNIFKSEVWYDSKKVIYSTDKNISFVYLFDTIQKIWKAYNPYPKNGTLKFFSNNIANHVQNFDKLGITGSDILFITKSYKDCIVLNKVGFDAIAPHCEAILLDPWYIDYLKTRYKHIYVFFDNDFTGVSKSTEFTERFFLNYINIPTSLSKPDIEIKDPWDVIKEYDYNLLTDIIHDKLIRDGI